MLHFQLVYFVLESDNSCVHMSLFFHFSFRCGQGCVQLVEVLVPMWAVSSYTKAGTPPLPFPASGFWHVVAISTALGTNPGVRRPLCAYLTPPLSLSVRCPRSCGDDVTTGGDTCHYVASVNLHWSMNSSPYPLLA